MPGALDEFRRELLRVNDFSARAEMVTKQFDQKAQTKHNSAKGKQAKAASGTTTPEQAAVLEAAAEERVRAADEALRAKDEWKSDIRRVYVLRLVTAFEVFLRGFIIERAASSHHLLLTFLKSRFDLRLDPPISLGGAGRAEARIATLVDKTCEHFSSLETASAYYGDWFVPKKGFHSNSLLAPPLDTQQAKNDALADADILFQLRHILTHKAGVPNAKYHACLTHASRRARLDPGVLDLRKSPHEAKPPDDILLSPAKYPGNWTKQDDFYQSLLALAEHIDAAYP